MQDDLILDVKDLCKSFYLHERSKRVSSASATSFKVYKGQLTALTGPSGVGKSSLLKCIYRTYLPTSGQIIYKNADNESLDLATLDERYILNLRQTEMSFVTQFLHILPRQSTLALVSQPLISKGETADQAHEQAAIILQALNIPESLWDVSPATFSGGERQRVNIARSLISPSRLLLLDEPTASLDTNSRDLVLELIEQKKQQGTAMLAIFHDPQLVDNMAEQQVEVYGVNETKEKSDVA